MEGLYDLILDIGCFHSLTQEGRQGYLRNVERLLDEEGTYLRYVFLRESGGLSPGMAEADLAAFPQRLQLTTRQDSTDSRGRPSAWLTFCKT